MGDRARAAAAVVVLLAAATAGVAGATAAAGPAHATAADSTAPTFDQSTAPTFDRLTIEVTVRADGSATWTFRYERVLANETEREAFESYARRVREEETALFSEFRDDARLLAEAGAAATNRSMAARDFRRDAFVRSGVSTDFGVVTLTFRWDGFARTDGDRVIAGDVFDGGLYLGPGEEFVVRPGERLSFAAADPPASQSNPESLRGSRSLAWEGERKFLDRRPRIEFAPAATPTPPPTPEPTPTATPTPAPAGGGGVGPGWVVAAALLLAGVAGVVGLAARGRSGGDGGAGPGAGPGDDDSSGGSGETGPAAAAAGAAGAGAAGSESDAGSGPGPGPGSGSDPDSAVDPTLLPDEERIVRLLEANGGRMRQARIVEATGWSKSKVSVTLSEMAEEGEVSKLRIGRENVVSLDGERPDATDPPVEDG